VKTTSGYFTNVFYMNTMLGLLRAM